MEDIRIGRKTRGSETHVTLTTTFAGFISADPLRVSFTVYPPVGDTIIITSLMGGADTSGLRCNDTTGPITLSLDTHGSLVQKQWAAKLVGAGGIGVFTDASLTDQ